MSGKRSRLNRKIKGFSKKAAAGAAAIMLCSTPVASEGGEFLLSLYPHFSFPVIKFDDSLTMGYGGGLRLTYRPTDYFNIFVEGDYKRYSFDTKQNIGNMSILEGTLGGGYHLPLTDRLGLNFDAGLGYYNATYTKGTDSNKTSIPVSGLDIKGSVSVSYKINPAISVFASAAAEHDAYKGAKFLTTIDVNPGLTINLTKAFSNKTEVSLGEQKLKPVFPVFYSWYNDNSFGEVEVRNGEDAAITDVTVYFYQPQYMGQPQNCGSKAVLQKGETFNVELKAFFNEQMLDLNEKTDTLTNVIVEYKYLGKKCSATFPMIVPIYGRNNMSWEDDRCASAFVSSKDPAAMWFSKYVISTIRDNVRSGVPQNIQYAMGVFEALDQFGINYVKDPTSAFEDNVGTSSIDFLQFPYQTLMYRGGDCDDLSILVCSLLESIGIETAFITIPGHIYMAFDSGLTVAQAQDYFLSLDEFIVDKDKVWVPLEITLSDEGFNKAWHKGAWEWTAASRTDTARLYRMTDSWQIYKPVNVPGATAKFTLPEETFVARLFSHSVDEFVMEQITPQVAWYENRIAAAPSAQNYNDFGVLYARYGLFEEAEKKFRIARSMNYLPSILNTANLYYSIKDYTRAENWYNEVLASDKSNTLALLGLARCAYEKGDYVKCDEYYGTVYETDITLAKRYSYLGAFEQVSGRSFSLADRLENTIWLQSADSSLSKGSDTKLADSSAKNDTVVKNDLPVQEAGILDVPYAEVAVAPTVTQEAEEEEEEAQASGEGDGEGGNDKAGDDSTPETYVGISSQLDFNILTAQDLAALAAETIEQNGETLDDFDTQAFSLSTQRDISSAETLEDHVEEESGEELAEAMGDNPASTDETISSAPDSAVTSLLTDVPLREVPRYTEQPSEQWAPQEAYTAESIPGMRSFDEEMGTYQNEKAYLLKDEYSFAINPGEAPKDEEEDDNTQQASLEVNPFASFLPAEDVAKMEQITNFKLDDFVKEENAKAEKVAAEKAAQKAATTIPAVATKPAATTAPAATATAATTTAPAATATSTTTVPAVTKIQTPVTQIPENSVAEAEVKTEAAAETQIQEKTEAQTIVKAPEETKVNAPVQAQVENKSKKTGLIAVIIAFAAACGAGLFIGLRRNKRKGNE